MVGTVGSSDLRRKFFGMIYDINLTEDQSGSSKMMSTIISIMRLRATFLGISNKFNTVQLRMMKDAGAALKAATTENSLLHIACLAHLVRAGNGSKSGNGSGVAGSLSKYLSGKGVHKEIHNTIIAVALAMSKLATVSEWIVARGLLDTWLRETGLTALKGIPIAKPKRKKNSQVMAESSTSVPSISNMIPQSTMLVTTIVEGIHPSSIPSVTQDERPSEATGEKVSNPMYLF